MKIQLLAYKIYLISCVMIANLMAPCAVTAEEPEKPVVNVKLRDLLPSKSRFFRGFSIKSIYLDQPDFLINSTTGDATANLDDHLWKFEISLDLGKIFWSTEELVEVYGLAAGKSTGQYVNPAGFEDIVNSKGTPLQFFARARRADRARRFLSAFSFSTGQSERVAAQVMATGNTDDDFAETYAATFDPKKFLLTTDRVLKAYKGLASYVKAHNAKSGLADCGALYAQGEVERLRALSCLKISQQSRAALIPSIEFKTVDQFDLASVGGQFITSDFVEGTIETITVTWDLKAALGTASRRRAAINAIAIDQELRGRDNKFGAGLKIGPGTLEQVCLGRFYHVPFSLANSIGSVTWRAEEFQSGMEDKGVPQDNSRALPSGLVLDKNGVLHGEATGDPKDLVVTAMDGIKKKATKRIPIKNC